MTLMSISVFCEQRWRPCVVAAALFAVISGSAAAQSETVSTLLKEGVRGIGISPVDAEGQVGVLREVAVKYLRKAGERAAARSAHREAIAFFEQTLSILGELPETPGLGMDLDEAKIEEQRPLSWTETRWS